MAATIGAWLIAGGTLAAKGTLAYAIQYGIGSLVVSTATSAILGALSPKPTASGANRGYQTTSLGPAQDHPIIYGKVKVGGAIVFDEATGTNNKFLHRVVAVAGHEVQSFDGFYINDDFTTLGTNGYVTNEKYTRRVDSEFLGGFALPIINDFVVGKFATDAGYEPKTEEEALAIGLTQVLRERLIRINTHNGSPDQLADTDLVSESSVGWSSSHRLQGIAYFYVRLAFNADIFPNGIPVVTTLVSGKKVYDPRTGNTAYSNNPALCLRDYLTSKYGLAEDTINIDDVLISTAANICDQTNTNAGTTRYTCNGAFTTASTPYDMISELLKSMGGTLWYAQGKWRAKPAYWTDTVMDLDLDDFRSSISVNTRHSRRDNFNVIKGTFRGEESNWQTTDYPQVTNAAFLAADGGQESVADVDLTFTDNFVEARRLGLISLERNRQQLTVNASFGLRTLALQVGDNITLTNSRFGWSNKEFEVIQWSFGLTDGLDLQTQMTLRETAQSVFDEVSDGVVYERDNTELLSPFSVPSVGLSADVVAKVFAEKLVNELTLTTTSGASERIDKVQVQYKDVSEDEYKNVADGPLGKFIIIDLEKSFYDVRARAVNTFGVIGEWEYLFNIEVDALSAPPADITNFGHELSGGTLFLDWDAVPDLDLSYYQVKHNSATTGANWGNSSVVLNKIARPATNASLPARSGTFTIKAFDKNLNESITATSLVVLPTELPPLGNTQEIFEAPDFSGSKTNCEVVNFQLQITDTTSSNPVATYLMQGDSDYIDTGSSRPVRVTGDVEFERVYNNGILLWDDIPQNWNTWPDKFDTWTNEDAAFGDVSVLVYVRSTFDDPDPTQFPIWGQWVLANGSEVVGRAFEFKAELSSTNTNFTPSVISLIGRIEY
ncbi:MAG: phage tail protein [Flavobacteriaceae bacterium]|nr:phage tail protein [Flavobacteriaceae bacterium]